MERLPYSPTGTLSQEYLSTAEPNNCLDNKLQEEQYMDITISIAFHPHQKIRNEHLPKALIWREKGKKKNLFMIRWKNWPLNHLIQKRQKERIKMDCGST